MRRDTSRRKDRSPDRSRRGLRVANALKICANFNIFRKCWPVKNLKILKIFQISNLPFTQFLKVCAWISIQRSSFPLICIPLAAWPSGLRANSPTCKYLFTNFDFFISHPFVNNGEISSSEALFEIFDRFVQKFRPIFCRKIVCRAIICNLYRNICRTGQNYAKIVCRAFCAQNDAQYYARTVLQNMYIKPIQTFCRIMHIRKLCRTQYAFRFCRFLQTSTVISNGDEVYMTLLNIAWIRMLGICMPT